MNGLVAKGVKGSKQVLEFQPAFIVQNAFSTDNFLIRIRQVLHKWPIHKKHMKKLDLSQTIPPGPGKLFKDILYPIRMQVIKEIKE